MVSCANYPVECRIDHGCVEPWSMRGFSTLLSRCTQSSLLIYSIVPTSSIDRHCLASALDKSERANSSNRQDADFSRGPIQLAGQPRPMNLMLYAESTTVAPGLVLPDWTNKKKRIRETKKRRRRKRDEKKNSLQRKISCTHRR